MPMTLSHKYYKIIKENIKFKGIPIPNTESLEDCFNRIFPYWNDVIAPQLRSNKKIFISAHGNILRTIIKYLEKRNVEDINIPTGKPLYYELSLPDLIPIKSMIYIT